MRCALCILESFDRVRGIIHAADTTYEGTALCNKHLKDVVEAKWQGIQDRKQA